MIIVNVDKIWENKASTKRKGAPENEKKQR